MIEPARSEAAVLSYALVLEEALALDIGIVKPTQQGAAAVG